jgi:tRNA pseudouridine55 synthase
MKKKGLPINGWIALDKPLGMTSTQAVGRVRRILNASKVGHGGTLDPLATGILPIALGEATKTIPYIVDTLKTYTFTVTWGEQRSTDDAEGEAIAQSDARPTMAEIESILPRYIGDIEQTPPQFSAIKINGERAYDIARDGETVDIKSRLVYIETLEIIPPIELSPRRKPGSTDSGLRRGDSLEGLNQTTFRCVCGAGTYIRSLGRDMGAELGCFGYISALRRDSVGPLGPENAISLEKLEEIGHSALLPVDSVLDGIPALTINQQEAARLKNGQSLSFISKPDVERLTNLNLDPRNADETTLLAVYNGKPIALVALCGVDLQPVRVLNL